jgi:hypothetical protein
MTEEDNIPFELKSKVRNSNYEAKLVRKAIQKLAYASSGRFYKGKARGN